MTGVVGMALQDGEGTVDLLEQDDAGEFVRERHLSEGKYGTGGCAGLRAETVRRADRQHDRLRISVLVVLEEVRELLGRQLFACGVEKNKGVGGTWTAFLAQFEQSGFVSEREALDFSIARDSLEVFVGQRLDCGVFCFAYPGDFEFHRTDLTIEDTRDHRGWGGPGDAGEKPLKTHRTRRKRVPGRTERQLRFSA